MLVRFISSETGEIMMFADAARSLLQVLGKDTTAKGAFLPDEMLAAARTLRDAASRAEAPPVDDEPDADGKKKEPVVALGQRAWPLIDMLERTAKGGAKANIVWEAAADF
ncbi:DUF1840 domain-containing protein [Dechloromonas sp. XY25]|uniref:DUF1840 domain-containing protein n=1 Tax=Dechloromonas hankyongensis TaxID=2908002 RepID=A0ABS9JY61_9RHOO|nr:DUF1840 domain-containing protein [Dechloromonas hankyongensis]MCG2575850.1 DUF1840 domain-containing protein [Dechloromonas hankyongensis]